MKLYAVTYYIYILHNQIIDIYINYICISKVDMKKYAVYLETV